MTFALTLAALLSLGAPHSVTAYTYTGNPTASGRWPVPGVTAACHDSIPFGTWVEIAGVGARRCDDRYGHSTQLDIFMATKQRARDFGRKTLLVTTR